MESTASSRSAERDDERDAERDAERAPAHRPDESWWSYLVLTAVTYAAVQFGSLLAIRAAGQETGLWPAAAVGISIILGAPRGRFAAVAITTVLANMLAHVLAPGPLVVSPLLTVGVRSVGDVGGAIVARQLLGDRPSFERGGWLLHFAALIALVVSPSVSLLAAVIETVQAGGPLLPHFVHWYVPEVVMILTAAPAVWVFRQALERARRTKALELAHGAVALVALLALTVIALREPAVAGIKPPISLYLVPVLLYLAYTFGVGTTSWGTVLSLGIAIVITAQGSGPFARLREPGLPRFVLSELYIGALGIPMIFLAAILQELRAASQRLQSLLGTIAAPVVVVDLDRRVVGYSSAAEELFRHGAGATLTMGVDPLVASEASPEVMQRRELGWRRALDGDVDVAQLTTLEGGNIEMRYAPMYDAAGAVVGAAATATDLDAQRRETQARDRVNRFETIGRVAGGIVHDTNNLMTVILGQVFELRSTIDPTAEQCAALDEIELTVERTKRLAAQLLAFSRAQVVEPRVLALHEEVRQILSLLRRVLEERSVLDAHVPDTGAYIAIDRGQLEQLLLNLVTNARDAMPRGGRVRLTSARTTLSAADASERGLAPGPFVWLDVSDQGPGIPPDVQSHIFEPFFTTKANTGNGLGLATVWAIMSKIGGTVEIAQTGAEGTTFRLWFPCVDPPVATEQPAVRREPERLLPSERTGELLVCEDEPAIRRIVARTLVRDGWRVEECATPQEALSILRDPTRQLQLLVTDVVMPGMSGIALLQAAREVRPELPVLLMTGYSEESLVDERARQDRTGVLTKPFHGDELIRRVHELLSCERVGASDTRR